MKLLDIVENKVVCAIDNIKTNSAPTPVGIPPKFINMAKVILALVLTKLYNKCLKEECSLENFKLSHVIPIPTTAAPKELSGFRPLSLLNIFLKIFEKILKDKIQNFINNNYLLTSEQFGFTTKSSTEQAITIIYDKFLDNLDKNSTVGQYFFILKNHLVLQIIKILLKKLYHYDFPGKFFDILKSYLENRKMHTNLNKNKSDKKFLKS